MTNRISIIIPVLNEAETIGSLLQHIIENSTASNISDVIVVDGGSTDGTQTSVLSFHNVILLNSEKGRAKQMNFGASQAKGSILYFLHADAFPPKDFDIHILTAVSNNHKAGCFRMQFDSNHWWLRLASWFTQFRWRACRGGDQSQFITQELFKDIGGFNEDYAIYEDNILINELYRRNEFIVLNKKIKTSARLYNKHGVWKVQYHFFRIYLKRWLGVSADTMYFYYKKHLN